MTSFLTDLERELRAAHPRRRSARRRAAAGRAARRAPGAVLVAAVVALAVVFLSPSAERDRRSMAPPSPAPVVEQPRPAAGPGRVAVLNGTRTPGLARGVAGYLERRFPVGLLGNAVRVDGSRTVVRHTRARRSQAQSIALELDASLAPLDPETRAAADGAPVVVEVGRDILGARSARLATPDGRTVGRAHVLVHRAQDRLAVEATLGRQRTYGVWARGADGKATFLGFPPTSTRAGRFRVAAAIRDGIDAREIIVSRERDETPTGDEPRDPLAVARLRQVAGR